MDVYKFHAVPNNDPPVTLQLGFPIVELPGCVEAHPDNKIGANRLPLDRNLVNDDPNGVQYYVQMVSIHLMMR